LLLFCVLFSLQTKKLNLTFFKFSFLKTVKHLFFHFGEKKKSVKQKIFNKKMPPKKNSTAKATTTTSRSKQKQNEASSTTTTAAAVLPETTTTTTTTTTKTENISSSNNFENQPALIRYNVQELTHAPWLFQPHQNVIENNQRHQIKNNNNQQQQHFLCPSLVRKLASEVDPTLVLSEDACQDVLNFVDSFLQDVVLGSARNARRRSRLERDRLHRDVLMMSSNQDCADDKNNNNNFGDDSDQEEQQQYHHDDEDDIKGKSNDASRKQKFQTKNNFFSEDRDEKLLPVILSAEDLQQEAERIFPKVFGKH
jgi:hypothetical protein